MRRNLLKPKWESGQPVIGTVVNIPNPIIANAMSKVGFDFIVFDMEHSPVDLWMIPELMIALEASDTEAVVRVPWNDFVTIKRVLDMGVYNIIVPMINTPAAARQAVAATRYPPEGIRGCGPWRAGGHGSYTAEYVKSANDEIGLFIQIEHIDAVNAVDQILSVKGVTGTYVGPADMSASMGRILDTTHPDQIKAMEKVLESCKSKGLVYGMATGTVETTKDWLAKGAGLVTLGSNLGFALSGARDALSQVK